MQPEFSEIQENLRQAFMDQFNSGLVEQWQAFLLPVLVLICWTLFMMLWMFAVRLPAMQKAQIDPNDARHTSDEAMKALPSNVRAVSDNFNHLHEQPTIFYALMIYVALTGGMSQTALYAAWAYVGLRILHSLVQVLSSNVSLRFFVFLASAIALIVLAGTQVARLVS